MKKKMVLWITAIIMVLCFWVIGATGDRQGQMNPEEFEIIAESEYTVDKVATGIEYAAEEVYKSNIALFNSEALYIMRENLEYPTIYSASYQSYVDGKLKYNGNIKRNRDEIMIESVGNEVRGEKASMMMSGVLEEGLLKTINEEKVGSVKDQKTLENINKNVISVISESVKAIKDLKDFSTIFVGENYFVKQINLDENYSVAGLIIANTDQLNGQKMEIKVSIGRAVK